MVRTYKYRIYPTGKQSKALDTMINTHRYIYNRALNERKEAWEQHQNSLSWMDQRASYKIAKESNEYYQEINVNSVNYTLKRLDRAFKDFFRRIKTGGNPGYPRFKAFNRFHSVELGYGNGLKIRPNRKLYIQYIGEIRLKQHRSIPGAIKTGIVKRKAGRYYIYFIVECALNPLEKTDQSIGLDMGLNKLITTSDSEFFDHPKYLRQSEQKLRKQQRTVARRQKGSNRRQKAVKILQRTHEHIGNQRRDTAHKIARKIINKYDTIAVEDLSIQNMLKNHHLAKSISDAGWSIFIVLLIEKAEEAAREVIKVDPAYTSQMCSGCGEIVKKDLSIRVHSCPFCGLVLDRDVNAAINILAKSMAWTVPSGVNVEVANSCVS